MDFKQTDYLSISEVLFPYEEMHMPHSGRCFTHRTKLIVLQAGSITAIQILNGTGMITFRLCHSVYILIRFNSCAIT